jgi:hypothetical protein
MINPNEVTNMFLDCLFKDNEIIDGKPIEEPIIVNGITLNIGFNPKRLNPNKNKIKEMLLDLPKEFHAKTGGGWSFLNMCNTKDGVQWTGLHKTMEQLCLLSIACEYAEFMLDKTMWDMFPGGVPYFCIKEL